MGRPNDQLGGSDTPPPPSNTTHPQHTQLESTQIGVHRDVVRSYDQLGRRRDELRSRQDRAKGRAEVERQVGGPTACVCCCASACVGGGDYFSLGSLVDWAILLTPAAPCPAAFSSCLTLFLSAQGMNAAEGGLLAPACRCLTS